jgi:hypothetical protein
MLKVHLGNLLTYFTHAISNAMTEGFNSKVQALNMLLAVCVHSLTSESGFYSSAEGSIYTPLSIKLSDEQYLGSML